MLSFPWDCKLQGHVNLEYPVPILPTLGAAYLGGGWPECKTREEEGRATTWRKKEVKYLLSTWIYTCF